jgi:hypothetical protein
MSYRGRKKGSKYGNSRRRSAIAIRTNKSGKKYPITSKSSKKSSKRWVVASKIKLDVRPEKPKIKTEQEKPNEENETCIIESEKETEWKAKLSLRNPKLTKTEKETKTITPQPTSYAEGIKKFVTAGVGIPPITATGSSTTAKNYGIQFEKVIDKKPKKRKKKIKGTDYV